MITEQNSKRILIISPEEEARNGIEAIVTPLYRKNLGEEFSKIELQLYPGFEEPPQNLRLENWKGITVLLIVDQQITPPVYRYPGSIKSDLIRGAYDASLNFCKEKGIPYVIYKGELKRGLTHLLIRELLEAVPDIRGKIRPDTP